MSMTSLYEAARGGQLECVRLLLERGADKEAKCEVRTCVVPAAACIVACCFAVDGTQLARCELLAQPRSAFASFVHCMHCARGQGHCASVAHCAPGRRPVPYLQRLGLLLIARRAGPRRMAAGRCGLPLRVASSSACGCSWSTALM